MLLGLFTIKMASAQSLTFSYEGQDVSNGEIRIETAEIYDDLKVLLTITNVSNQQIMVKLIKDVVLDIEGTFNSFCFGENCYPPSTIESDSYAFGPGESTGDGEFYVEFVPAGHEGKAIIKYTAFNENNPSDNVTLTIVFLFGATSVDTNLSQIQFRAYPNPVQGGNVFIDYSLPASIENPTLAIYNMLGVNVYSAQLSNESGKVQVSTNKLPKGIYFYSVESNNRKLVTKKLIIR